MKNLHTMNDWGETPKEYTDHYEAVAKGEHHDVSEIKLGNCWYRIVCKSCDICWDVDSSD